MPFVLLLSGFQYGGRLKDDSQIFLSTLKKKKPQTLAWLLRPQTEVHVDAHLKATMLSSYCLFLLSVFTSILFLKVCLGGSGCGGGPGDTALIDCKIHSDNQHTFIESLGRCRLKSASSARLGLLGARRKPM